MYFFILAGKGKGGGVEGNKEEVRRERGEEERKRGGVKMDGKGQSLYISFIILTGKGKGGGFWGILGGEWRTGRGLA